MDCCSRSGRVASAWTCVLHSTPQSATGLELLACGEHRLVGQAEFAANVVDGGLGTVNLGHVGFILALGHVGAVSKAEALVNSVDDGGVLRQQERRDCPGGKEKQNASRYA